MELYHTKMERVKKVSLIFMLFAVFQLSEQNNLLVQTTSGTVEGVQITTVAGSTINAFFGIPYAQPPLGDLRFKPPIPLTPSGGVLSAQKKSKACVQGVTISISFSKEAEKQWIPPVEETSEDCLYLNVWTPSPKPQKAAVMVWIHGGAYQGGTANSDMYDGQILASQGVIVVSMNYRLSVLGFLLMDPDEIPGNVGLMDQALALKWVQRNIEKFGGDPNRVTIFGESAGAVSVGQHLLIPSSQGLFQKAILQSGAGQAPWSFVDKPTALKSTDAFLKVVGCDLSSHSEKIKCLRDKDAIDIVASAKEVTRQSSIITFPPAVDGQYIVGDPRVLLGQRKIRKEIDLLLGSTGDDGYFIPVMSKHLGLSEDFVADEESFLDYSKSIFGSDNPMLTSVVKFLYTNWEEETVNWRRPITDLATDFSFTCPVVNVADQAAANGNKVYFYQFEHKPSTNRFPSWTGVSHADELTIVFGIPTVAQDTFTPEEAELSKKVMKYWTNFAKSGNPNLRGDEAWPLYTIPNKKALIINLKDEIVNGVRVQRCGFFNKLLPEINAMLHENELQHCDKSDPNAKCSRK